MSISPPPINGRIPPNSIDRPLFVSWLRKNHTLLTATTKYMNRYSSPPELMMSVQMAGTLLSPASPKQTSIEVLFERGIPVVTIDRRLAAAPVDSIMVNNQRAAHDAVLHLIGQGCRRVGLVVGPVETTTGASRLAGYRAALRDAGRTLDPSLIAYGNFRTDGGYQATRQLLRQRRPRDGLLISNNLMTIGGLQAIAEARRGEVPAAPRGPAGRAHRAGKLAACAQAP